MGEEREVCRVLVGKPEGKRPLGRPRRRWVDNIRMDLREVGRGYMDWIGLAQDRDRWRTLVSAVMNLRVPWNARNFLTSWKPLSFSRRTLRHGVSKYYFIVLLIGSTCFGHCYAHHKELANMMLITTLVMSFCIYGGGSVSVKLWFTLTLPHPSLQNETTNVVINIKVVSSWWSA